MLTIIGSLVAVGMLIHIPASYPVATVQVGPDRPVGACGALDGSRIIHVPCNDPAASLQIAAVLGGSSCPSETTRYENDSALGVVCWTTTP